jgi:uncharacterized beta-barrel protein YwiB (DUF1934 family)
MTKEVSITIEGVQIGAEEAPILMTASGTYHMQNGKHYIQYEEQPEEGQGCIKNMIKISAVEVAMTKKGTANSEMNFVLNHNSQITYQTPYGNLFFEAQTSLIKVVEKDTSLEVTMEYSLFSNEDHISDHRTIIRIHPTLS